MPATVFWLDRWLVYRAVFWKGMLLPVITTEHAIRSSARAMWCHCDVIGPDLWPMSYTVECYHVSKRLGVEVGWLTYAIVWPRPATSAERSVLIRGVPKGDQSHVTSHVPLPIKGDPQTGPKSRDKSRATPGRFGNILVPISRDCHVEDDKRPMMT